MNSSEKHWTAESPTSWAPAAIEGLLPQKVSQWTLTTIRERLIKIGAKVVIRHAKYVTLQLAEVAIPRNLFAMILDRIAQLRLKPDTG